MPTETFLLHRCKLTIAMLWPNRNLYSTVRKTCRAQIKLAKQLRDDGSD